MANQFSPGKYSTKGDAPAKVTGCRALGGEWRLVGAIFAGGNIWVLAVWTLTGSCVNFPGIGDLIALADEEDNVPEVFL